jgi:hypothetical protein
MLITVRKGVKIRLNDVAVVPNSPARLISASKIRSHGGGVLMPATHTNKPCVVHLPNHDIVEFFQDGKLFVLKSLVRIPTALGSKPKLNQPTRLSDRVGEHTAFPVDKIKERSKSRTELKASARAALAALDANEAAQKACAVAQKVSGQAKLTMVQYAKLYHERLCHISKKYLQAFGFKDCSFDCTECAIGKAATKKQTRGQRTRPPYKYHTIHVDLAGPLPQSKEGYRYICGIVCGKTDETKMYPIKRKSDAVLALKKYILKHNLKHRMRLRAVQCDGGGEFISDEIDAFKGLCTTIGAEVHTSAPHNQAQNGKIERKWRFYKDAMRIMRRAAKQPAAMWPYALQTAVYTLNRIPHRMTQRGPDAEEREGRYPNAFVG